MRRLPIREAVEGGTQLSEAVFAKALRESYEEVWFGTLEPEMTRLLAREEVTRLRMELGLRMMDTRAEQESDE